MYTNIKYLLQKLEEDLKVADLWDLEIPSIEDLNSIEPFSIDKLTFVQWLQFIFIPKMNTLIDENKNMPQSICIYPMAVESFKNYRIDTNEIANTINEIDRVLNDR